MSDTAAAAVSDDEEDAQLTELLKIISRRCFYLGRVS